MIVLPTAVYYEQSILLPIVQFIKMGIIKILMCGFLHKTATSLVCKFIFQHLQRRCFQILLVPKLLPVWGSGGLFDRQIFAWCVPAQLQKSTALIGQISCNMIKGTTCAYQDRGTRINNFEGFLLLQKRVTFCQLKDQLN